MQRNNLSSYESVYSTTNTPASTSNYTPSAYYYDSTGAKKAYSTQSYAGYAQPQVTVTNYYTPQNSHYTQSMQTAGYNQPFINSTNPFVIALQNLRTKIANALQQHQYDKARSDILNQSIASINNLQAEAKDNSLLLDLYLTINSIYTACINTSSDLTSAIKQIFGQREDFLLGDCHDYFYCQSLANQFCQNVAKIVFPQSAPLSVLLTNARTKNRQATWQDVASLENDIVSSAEYFRSSDNCIHSYQAVLDSAITILKRGYFEENEIWHGTDVKNLKALSKDSLFVLKQRSGVLRQLIEYTESLSANVGFITQIFAEWRKGLADGRTGGNDEAKKPAYEANKEFFKWWNDLEKTAEGKIIRARISEIKELDEFIKELSSVISVGKCVDGYQCRLERILGRYRENISKIENICFQHISDVELDRIKRQIENELDVFRPIKTNHNAFADLAQKNDFMKRFDKNPTGMTFQSVSFREEAKPKPIVHSKPVDKPKPISAFNPFNDEPVKTTVREPEMNYQPARPLVKPIYEPVQKHGLFKHFRERREEKKIEKRLQKGHGY